MSKSKKKQHEKIFGKQLDEVIDEWDEAAEIVFTEELNMALNDMKAEVVQEIVKIKKEDLKPNVKKRKIQNFVIEKLKADEVINSKFEDELYEAQKFRLTRKSWSNAIKAAWEFTDKIAGAKAILFYCYSWQTRHCEMIPLQTTEGIFLYEEKREMFYLDRPFLVINDKPVYFVLSGLIFSYELNLNIDGLATAIENIKEFDNNFIAQRKHLSSRAMYTIWQDAVLDRFAGYKPTLKDKIKQFALPFIMGILGTLVICMPSMMAGLQGSGG